MKQIMADVGRLKYLDGNRSIDDRHVTKLKAALQKNNLMHLRPILVNKKMEILDGQHRVEAYKELGIAEIPAIIYDMSVPLSDVQEINMLSKGWKYDDFARSFASQGKTDYAEYLDMRQRTGLVAGICIALLSGRTLTSGGGGSARHTFIKGGFKVKRRKEAELIVGYINDFKERFKFAGKRNFQSALISVVRSGAYDHERMLKKLEKKTLTLCNSTEEYVKQLEDIYNFHEKSGSRISLKETS